MILHHFLLPANESNAYLVACPDTRKAMLIDAGCFQRDIVEYIEEHQLLLEHVFITHDHSDHTGGIPEILEIFQPQIHAGHKLIEGAATKLAAHGDVIEVGNLRGQVLTTPGHTPDSLSLAFAGHVFTGDALFAGSVGGTTSPGESLRQIEAVCAHILTLPEHYEVHPGHGPSSTIQIEKHHNPFFA
jgi:glyoxylase-like metal-dependent hydrolase (beta-lactamase superfamily II)